MGILVIVLLSWWSMTLQMCVHYWCYFHRRVLWFEQMGYATTVSYWQISLILCFFGNMRRPPATTEKASINSWEKISSWKTSDGIVFFMRFFCTMHEFYHWNKLLSHYEKGNIIEMFDNVYIVLRHHWNQFWSILVSHRRRRVGLKQVPLCLRHGQRLQQNKRQFIGLPLLTRLRFGVML